MKTRKTKAENGVKNELIASALPPRSTVRVLTTLSFAVKPVISAVDILQSSKPSGRNSGLITEPRIARMLSDESDTGFSLISKLCRNQIIIVATKIIVKALVTKSFVLSQISCITERAEGIR